MPDEISKFARYVNKEDYSEEENNISDEFENEQEINQEFLNDNALAEEFTNTQIADVEKDEDEEASDIEKNGNTDVVDSEVDEEDDSSQQDTKRQSIFRSFAGVALIYIAYSGFSEYFKGASEDMPLYFLIFYTVFGAVGIGLFINSIMNERKSRKNSDNDDKK